MRHSFKKVLLSICSVLMIALTLTGCTKKMNLANFADIVQGRSYLVTDASGSDPNIKVWKVARLTSEKANIQYIEFTGSGAASVFYGKEVQNLKNISGNGGGSAGGSFTLTDRNYYYHIMQKGKYIFYGTCPATYTSTMKDIMGEIAELEEE